MSKYIVHLDESKCKHQEIQNFYHPEAEVGDEKIKTRMQLISYSVGVLLILAGIIAAFIHLDYYYFTVFIISGSGFMGMPSICDKICAAIRCR